MTFIYRRLAELVGRARGVHVAAAASPLGSTADDPNQATRRTHMHTLAHTNAPAHTPDGAPRRRRKRSRRKESQQTAPSDPLTAEHSLTGSRVRLELSRISESSKAQAAPPAHKEDSNHLGREKSRSLRTPAHKEDSNHIGREKSRSMSKASTAPRPSAPPDLRARASSASVVVCDALQKQTSSGSIPAREARVSGAGGFYSMFGRHHHRPHMPAQPRPVSIEGDEFSIGGRSLKPEVIDSLTGDHVATDTVRILPSRTHDLLAATA